MTEHTARGGRRSGRPGFAAALRRTAERFPDQERDATAAGIALTRALDRVRAAIMQSVPAGGVTAQRGTGRSAR